MPLGEEYFEETGGQYVFYPQKGGRGYMVTLDEKEHFIRWFQRVGLAFVTLAGPVGTLMLVFWQPNLLPFGLFIAVVLGIGYGYQARWVKRFIGEREASEPKRNFKSWLMTSTLATPSIFYIAITVFFFALAIATGAVSYTMISMGGDWALFPLSCLSLLFGNIYLAWTLYVWDAKRKERQNSRTIVGDRRAGDRRSAR